MSHAFSKGTRLTLQRTRALRLGFRALALGFALVFLAAVAHHVYRLEFKSLAAFCLPILLLFFAFASLLYNRGKALAKGKGQTRSLYAAERAMQAAIWHLLGIVLGISLYAALNHSGMDLDTDQPSLARLWLLVFLAPYVLMQIGLTTFMRAVWIITPQFFRRVDAFELRRRVQQ